jgi:hypothetical protein
VTARAQRHGDLSCQVFWGSHGCRLVVGHDKLEHGHPSHVCWCCRCQDHENDPDEGCVGQFPYYGPGNATQFYGRDAHGPDPAAMKRRGLKPDGKPLEPGPPVR